MVGGCRDAGGVRLRLSKQVDLKLRCRLEVSNVRHSLMSNGKAFQINGVATEKNHRANQFLFLEPPAADRWKSAETKQAWLVRSGHWESSTFTTTLSWTSATIGDVVKTMWLSRGNLVHKEIIVNSMKSTQLCGSRLPVTSPGVLSYRLFYDDDGFDCDGRQMMTFYCSILVVEVVTVVNTRDCLGTPVVTEQKSLPVRTLSWRTRIPQTTRLGTRFSVTPATCLRAVMLRYSEIRQTTTKPFSTYTR